jgi:hypothetical protein
VVVFESGEKIGKDEMARKRKDMIEYWNRRLVKEGLSIDKGRSRKLVYIGGATDVEMTELIKRTDTGRTPPIGSHDESNTEAK